MSGLITMGLGPKQLLLTMGLGSPGGILPPPVVIRKKGGVSKGYSFRKSEEENKFLESWIIEVSSVDIYSKVEKEIDMKPNITIKVGDKEVRLSKGDINKNINVTVERVRINSE
jgi:hypothetical protein